MWKKYLKIGLAIIIISAVLSAGYYFWKKFNLSENLAEILFNSKEKTAPTEVVANPLRQLSDNEIFDYWLNEKTNSIYYLTKEGRVMKLTNNNEEIANSQTINRLNKVESSHDGSYAVAKFNFPELPTFSIFNAATNGWQPLPANIVAAAWSPDSPEIAYLDSQSLKILNLASQKTTEILKMSQKEVNLNWVSKNTMLLESPPSIDMNSSLWSLNLASKTLIQLIPGESGLMANWSADGEFAIKLHNQNRAPLTSLIDKNGSALATLSFVTIPSKCLIESNKIYCAVPKNLRGGLKLPDDYLKKAVYFDDGIYLVDLSTGSSKILQEPIGTIDAEHLQLRNGELLFKNRLDDKLYSLVLSD